MISEQGGPFFSIYSLIIHVKVFLNTKMTQVISDDTLARTNQASLFCLKHSYQVLIKPMWRNELQLFGIEREQVK